MSCCVCVPLKLDLRPMGVVNHSTARTRVATKTYTNTCMNDLGVPPALNSKRGSPPSGLHLRFGASLNNARHWRLQSGATLRAANATHPTVLHEHAPQQKPAPRGIGGCVRKEASIEGVRFRCRLQTASRLYSFPTHRNLRHAPWRLKRAFRFREVLWLLSSKESNNRNKHRALFASRRGR
jgi:hypothetical protein